MHFAGKKNLPSCILKPSTVAHSSGDVRMIALPQPTGCPSWKQELSRDPFSHSMYPQPQGVLDSESHSPRYQLSLQLITKGLNSHLAVTGSLQKHSQGPVSLNLAYTGWEHFSRISPSLAFTKSQTYSSVTMRILRCVLEIGGAGGIGTQSIVVYLLIIKSVQHVLSTIIGLDGYFNLITFLDFGTQVQFTLSGIGILRSLSDLNIGEFLALSNQTFSNYIYESHLANSAFIFSLTTSISLVFLDCNLSFYQSLLSFLFHSSSNCHFRVLISTFILSFSEVNSSTFQI